MDHDSDEHGRSSASSGAEGRSGEPGEQDAAPPIVAGAFQFKDWWTTVWLRDGVPRWPERCACCGCGRDVQKAACAPRGEEDGREVHYPVCDFCLRHARTDENVVGWSALVSVIGAPVTLEEVGIPADGIPALAENAHGLAILWGIDEQYPVANIRKVLELA
jgi:hypothetical protein